MHDARTVNGLEGFGHPRHQPQQRGHRQRSAPGDGLRERGPGHVEGGEPGRHPVRLGIDQLGGVRPADPPGRFHLPAEPPPERRVLGQLRPYHLDRDGAAAPGVREVDPAHAARTEPGHEAVAGHRQRIVRLQRLEHLGRTVHRFPPIP